MSELIQNPLVAVVDDNPDSRTLFRLMTELLGCTVQEFEDGVSFLATANRDIACVILDEGLPRLRGHEVFHLMRRAGWVIPVISSSVIETYEEMQERYGYDGPVALAGRDSLGLLESIRKGLRAAGYCPPTLLSVPFDPEHLAWNGGTIRQMARTIAVERAFHDLPILGDALEDAGCANADILDHCRRPGVHVRGCWVLDLLLRNE